MLLRCQGAAWIVKLVRILRPEESLNVPIW